MTRHANRKKGKAYYCLPRKNSLSLFKIKQRYISNDVLRSTISMPPLQYVHQLMVVQGVIFVFFSVHLRGKSYRSIHRIHPSWPPPHQSFHHGRSSLNPKRAVTLLAVTMTPSERANKIWIGQVAIWTTHRQTLRVIGLRLHRLQYSLPIFNFHSCGLQYVARPRRLKSD